MKNKKQKIIVIVSSLIGLIILCFFLGKIFNKKEVKEKIDYLANFSQENIVFNHSFDEVNSIVIKKNEEYEAHLFNTETGEELKLEDIINKNKYDKFKAKIDELIYLKYPNFIADELVENARRVYSFYQTELMIYFYDYNINPVVNEELNLKVDYGNIAEFLNFPVIVNEKITSEDGMTIDNNKKHVAITFDDGPSNYTINLSKILINNKAHATFFFLGRSLESQADAVKEVFKAGHEIGYHSYNHTNLKRQTTEQISSEFRESNEILKSIIGTEFSLTRPPYGSINNSIKAALDTPFILWSIDTNDWRYRDCEYLYNYVLENIYDGAIILFHDTHKTSIEAIEKILPELYCQGYQVVTVSELANIKNTTLEKHVAYRYFKSND